MSTSKIVLRTVEEFMQGYVPVYQPIYPLFLGKSQQYSEEVGQINFKRIETIGDIRSKHVTPKDTEMRVISAKEGQKTLKKYFLGSKFIQSSLQDPRGIEDVIANVLDEHHKQADEIFSMGEGTSGSDVINNGLFWSGDANYVTNNSYQVLKGSNSDYVLDLHKKVMSVASTQSDLVAGRKIVMFYGDNIVPLFNALFAVSNEAFKTALSEVLGPNYSLMKLPANIVPSGANGFLIANMDQVKTHYLTLPKLAAQGVNEEGMYSWHNFLQGSWMVECLAYGAIVKQPLTLEA